MTLNRRQFAAFASAGLVADRLFGQSSLTAQQVVERIQGELAKVGVNWREQTVDTFKGGDPNTPVSGIVTTVMSTLDVLRRAAAAGKNMVITHEPTYYNGQDDTSDMQQDELYLRKVKFIKDNGLVVWRFHDHWHAKKPDGMPVGVAKLLGWSQYQVADRERSYVIPEATLGAVAKHIKSSMGIKTMRVVGDPAAKISRVAISPGYSNLQAALRTLPNNDLFIVGEAREWEGVEYAFDAMTAGLSKGLIVLGHTIAEDPGMDEAADWLRGIVPEVPIEFIPAGEPFWTPA
ncbi:MAG: Nif3-like dinuclear metal center hexameric protein [Acidobacteria bacterium]|nr:Nif3-like dinuclear metal center hexameric protein [Acidobacteriota bacterium]MDA1235597.1 Nif3-like dinuclear metal center hexameric protein [Acidobacteriota bacterium]